MKKFFVCLFAAFALLATSCSKDEDSNSPANNATATIEGKAYSFSDLTWMDITFNGVKTYSISSDDEKDNGNLFNINLSEKKTSAITINNANAIKITIGTNVYSSTSGTITVTTFNDKNIIGSFTAKFSKKGDTKTYDITGSFTSQYVLD